MRTEIIYGMPDVDYRKADGIAQSDLKECEKSPYHYKWKVDHREPHEPTSSMVQGLVTESFLFFKDQWNADGKFVIEPEDFNGRTKEGKAWKEAQKGKIIATKDHIETATRMMQAIKRHAHIADIFSEGNPQTAWFAPFKYGNTELQKKGLVDWIPETEGVPWNMLVDYKTTQCASKKEFSKKMAEYRYDVQSAYYLDGFNEAEQQAKPHFDLFCFVVQETVAPWEAAAYVIDPKHLGVGRLQYHTWLEAIARATESGFWPSYQDEKPEFIELPKWFTKQVANPFLTIWD